MHLMQVDCEVTYDGRGYTTLPRGYRLVIIKDDYSVAIHQDKGIRPLNYMSKSAELSQQMGDDGYEHLIVSSNKETIDIKIYEILMETFIDFPDEAELQRQGTEKQLQAWLANEDNFRSVLGDGIEFVTREFQTGKGAVDLLGIDKSDGQIALIEVKREAKRNDPFQVVRYKTALKEHRQRAIASGEDSFTTTATKDAIPIPVEACSDPHMILVAPRFKRGVAAECEKRGVLGLQMGDEWQETADFSITGTHKNEIVGQEATPEAEAKPKARRRRKRKAAGDSAGTEPEETPGAPSSAEEGEPMESEFAPSESPSEDGAPGEPSEQGVQITLF